MTMSRVRFQLGLSMAEFMDRFGSDDTCEAAGLAALPARPAAGRAARFDRVEIDDAYLGGERSGGKVGRGSENKVPFVAAVQTTPDRTAAVRVPASAAAHA